MYISSAVATTSSKINCTESNLVKTPVNANESPRETKERSEKDAKEVGDADYEQDAGDETNRDTEILSERDENEIENNQVIKRVKTKRIFSQRSKVWKHFIKITKNNKDFHVCQVVKNGNVCGKI